MRTLTALTTTVAAVGLAAVSGVASAKTNWDISIGFGLPYYYAPAPVYVSPPPPVYYRPAPVVVPPPRVYYGPSYYYGRPYAYDYRWRDYRGYDRHGRHDRHDRRHDYRY